MGEVEAARFLKNKLAVQLERKYEPNDPLHLKALGYLRVEEMFLLIILSDDRSEDPRWFEDEPPTSDSKIAVSTVNTTHALSLVSKLSSNVDCCSI